MKQQSKWADFLFTMAVRFVCGVLFGGVACFLFFWRGILRSFSRNHMLAPLIILIGCGLIGGFVAVFTVPKWQTPWYKGIRERDDEEMRD